MTNDIVIRSAVAATGKTVRDYVAQVEAERDRYREALEHIAVHGEHGQECHRPPQDCAADALGWP